MRRFYERYERNGVSLIKKKEMIQEDLSFEKKG